MPNALESYLLQQKYIFIDVKKFTDDALIKKNGIASDFFRLERMQHLNDYKSFKNVITRIDKNLKKCSESLYDKFLNAINSAEKFIKVSCFIFPPN